MSLISREEIKELLAGSEDPSVSIYMPTRRIPSETRQDIIRLKDLIKEARRQLTAKNVRSRDINALMEPVEALVNDPEFWPNQWESLAILSSRRMFRYYKLPLSLNEHVVVADRFYLKPLLSLLTGDGQYYILALSQKEVRLFQATRYEVHEVQLEDVPQSLAEAVRYEEKVKAAHHHVTGPAAGRGRYSAIFFGWHFGDEDKKEDILKFFRSIDRKVSSLLKGERVPLVLACVDYLASLYREVNHYDFLLDESIPGSPEGKSPEELRQSAWKIVEPYYEEGKRQARERYSNARGTWLASSEVSEIVPSAYYGRVDVAFASMTDSIWGDFVPETGETHIYPQQQPGCEDLVDFVSIHTLLNGGTVYVVPRAETPENTPLAALFRY